MKRRTLLMIGSLFPWLTACAQTGKPQADRELQGMGMVVVYKLAPGTSKKAGVQALNDAGNQMFSASSMSQQGGGGTSSVGGSSKMSFPRWVRVTWREGPGIDMDFKNGGWIGGTIVGDYKVEVLSRIPAEIFTYVAAARGRAIVLRFRLKDDGVLLAWDVQESSANGQGWVYRMHGGDFQDAEIYNGKVIDPGWQK
jgi:hypothetical protein